MLLPVPHRKTCRRVKRMIDESLKWLITKQPKGEAVTQHTPLLTNLEPHDPRGSENSPGRRLHRQVGGAFRL